MELFSLDFGLVFWMFVSFVVLFCIMWKWELIDKGVLYAREAKEQLDNAKQQAEHFEAEARSRQAEIVREAEQMKIQIIEEARAEAAREAKKEMEAAQVAIQQARKEAQLSFRNEVNAAAIEIARSVVRGQLADSAAQAQLVDTLIDQFEEGKN
jgi:F-type H+-transporting ATPase subunit b